MYPGGWAAPGVEPGTPVLELRQVSKRYGSLQVLEGVNVQARRGEVVGIVGPNGAGKTTLLRCIADGREQSSGDILVNGKTFRFRGAAATVDRASCVLRQSFEHAEESWTNGGLVV